MTRISAAAAEFLLCALLVLLLLPHAIAATDTDTCAAIAAEIAKKDPAQARTFLETCMAPRPEPKKQAWRKSSTPISEFDQVRYKCMSESKFAQPAAGREYWHDLFIACMRAHGYEYREIEK